MLAARQIGAYFVPLNWHFKANEAGYILRDSGAKALVINSDLLAQICKGIPPGMLLLEVKPDSGADVQRDSGITSLRNIDWYARWTQAKPLTKVSDRPRGMIAYTSGTTGLPKGVQRVPPRPEETVQRVASGRATVRRRSNASDDRALQDFTRLSCTDHVRKVAAVAAQGSNAL